MTEEKPKACCAGHTRMSPEALKEASLKFAYICPMCPGVGSDKPAACPKCGMALEPSQVSAEVGPNPELDSMNTRFWGALMMTFPIFIVEMASHMHGPFGDYLRLLPSEVLPRFQLLFSAPVILWAGWPFLVRGLASLKRLSPNMFTLIALGTWVAWGYSLVATVMPARIPEAFRTSNGAAAVYFEAACVIITLALLGQVLELKAREKTGGALRALMKLAPPTARRINDEKEEEVEVGTIAVGDLLRIRAAERIPVDGVVMEGESHVDESMLTGESVPVSKEAGSPVTGGSLNQAGSFIMRAEKVGADTLLARIVGMVGEAQRSRAPVQRLADSVAEWFVPAVVTVAIITFIYWSLLGPPPAMAWGIMAAVSVLIIACPCALGLATPMSVMAAVGRGALSGVLVKDAASLERLEKADTVVIDKTGTLTEGRPQVVDAMMAEGLDRSKLLSIAAALEQGSHHPIARALLDAAKAYHLTLPSVAGFQSLTGKGVRGVVNGQQAVLGNTALMADMKVDVAYFATKAAALQAEGATIIFLSLDERAAGLIAVADPVKGTAHEAIRGLQKAGLKIVMLTGDNRATAVAVAKKLGIDEVIAEVLPNEKAAAIKKLQSQGRVVAMAGDGTNDAPALAAADAGIAMSDGTDIAIDSAGITLLHGDLSGILRAIKLSRAMMRNIRQNLFFAFAYNALGVPVAAGVLYPLWGIMLSPMMAAAAMSLSSVSVIVNSLRLRRTKI